jgi:hypothetical protein
VDVDEVAPGEDEAATGRGEDNPALDRVAVERPALVQAVAPLNTARAIAPEHLAKRPPTTTAPAAQPISDPLRLTATAMSRHPDLDRALVSNENGT